MANSKEFLLQTMKGRANTLGWGAIVSFNRTKVNHLLAQQHIARFTTESFLPAIRGEISLEGTQTVELSGIILSEPRLSFENASLSDAMARLHMDIVGGTLTLIENAPGSASRAISSFNIAEQHGYSLDANIELRKVVGTINKKSEVVLDLSMATGFTSNLIETGISDTLIGNFFKTQFDALPMELQVYSLGILELGEEDLLAPKDFYLLTQAAPGAKNLKADTYGDGAVVMFVRTKNSLHNGVLPENDTGMPYFIPDDKASGEDRSLYSGSLLISRQAMFHWYIAPYISTHVGRGLSFEVKDDSEETGNYKLEAVSGRYEVPPIDIIYDAGSETYHFKKEDFSIKFAQNLSILIKEDYRLALRWAGTQDEVFHYKNDVSGWFDTHQDIGINFNFDMELIFDSTLDSVHNSVHFVKSTDSHINTEALINFAPAVGAPEELRIRARQELKKILETIEALFTSLDIPEINFFAINHLLFPESNALILKEAYLPGDLALFGEIDPRQSSFSLSPLYTTLKAGEELQFEIVELRYQARAALITWGVRDIDGSRAQGDITQSGRYTAPSLGLLEDKTTRNVITATYTDPQTQKEVTASAMVVVVSSSMAMAPAMHAIDLRFSPQPFVFKAASLTENPLAWTLLPADMGTLAGNGRQATYTPPATAPAGIFNHVAVEATDTVTQEKCTGIVLLVNGVMPVDIEPAFHPGLAPSASVTLSKKSMRDAPKSLTWSVEVGTGHVDDASGTFTAPAQITFPYSVVKCSSFDGISTQSGYSVIHLSEVAPRAQWSTVIDFKVEEQSGSATVFANGLAQVMLKVSVQPKDENNNKVDLTASEKASVRLIFEDSLNTLPYVGENGIPEKAPADKQWAANKSESGYLYYPATARSPLAGNDNSVFLYVQTRGVIPRKIAAALTRADNVEFNSTENNGSEESHNFIEIKPVAPPAYAAENYEFPEPVRVEGAADNNFALNTVDYYTLRLKDGNQYINFLSLEFEGHPSMVQWESHLYAEEMGSYTGYSLSGSRTLQFDPVFMQTIPPDLRPASTLADNITTPQGSVLISLHRRKDFPYNKMLVGDFTTPVRLKLIDEFGNLHRITVQFESPTKRNKVIIVPD
ncbi:hypothetical protein N018_09715 [Pseudomonas syringae CC1557]|uniref:Uncharacterized protein n=1 Tax=Pseudomonas syringae CC1557 TaxID=1357279 RepID=W0N244_PSESX|nr:hypothetical protein [Pseudomonas syringae]AHG43540.1 hypothetical protein N018_09715 [Pseudomonas syringae CC1557]